ncbi:phosphoribosyltransferase family protein [Dactylosporangium darangshiense]|uniref:Phosphoribosyltransferase family protein n=1 Tax=Dactylosporangium darangshiense TaxID=579108 RepID=A0ABP8DTD9_9ACTN
MILGNRVFANRVDAGRQLAGKLSWLRGQDVVVLGLPRGGVPVAYQVAAALRAPLDVIIVRKLGVPEQPELGMGAIGEDGVRVLNPRVIRHAGVPADALAAVEESERAVLAGRARLLRGDRVAEDLRGRTAVIVDDGIATGSTAKAACQVARARGASRVVLAVPVAPADLIEPLRRVADDVVCVRNLRWLWAIGQWYADFTPTSDDEVRELLAGAARRVSAEAPAAAQHGGGLPGRDEEVVVGAGDLNLAGHLTLPSDANGLVLFAHGSGSSRHSPRNRYVALILNQVGLGTLLFDLLTSDEAASRANVFDIELLAERLAGVSAWAHDQPWARDLNVGWFGASTGAAAALWAAGEPHARVAAIVSRGGRPDLAGARLPAVKAPTLLIVGGLDTQVLALNRGAQSQLRCPNELVVVPGATHLFEEPGTLTAAARHAREWFTAHLRHGAYAGRPPA